MKKWVITAIWLAMGFIACGCATQPEPKQSGIFYAINGKGTPMMGR